MTMIVIVSTPGAVADSLAGDGVIEATFQAAVTAVIAGAQP